MLTDTKPVRRSRRGTRGGYPTGIWTAAIALAVVLSGCLGGSDTPTTPEVATRTVSGRVTEPQSQQPIAGALVHLTAQNGQKLSIEATFSTTTDADGRYTFENVEYGTYTLSVDASGVVVDVNNPDLEYADFTMMLSVDGDTPAEIDASLPVVDRTQGGDVVPGESTVLEPADIPGLRIEIAAGAVTFPDGSTSGELHVVQLGFDQGPAHLPQGWAPAMMIRILPEGTRFDPPASVRFPNRDALPAGRTMELFSFDAASQTWASDGEATSSGDFVSGNAGIGISTASTHFMVCGAHTASGRIVNQDEIGVVGASVQVWARVNPFGQEPHLVPLRGVEAQTDAAGSFSVPGLRSCNVAFSAVLDQPDALGELEPGDAVPVDASGTTQMGTRLMQVQRETFFSVHGTVRDQEGAAVGGAHVEVFDPHGSGTAQGRVTQSNLEGGYTLVELRGEPGQELGIYAFLEGTSLNTEVRFQVPPLAESGSVLTIDLRLCDDSRSPMCGDWGTWVLNGNIMHITESRVECGQVVIEESHITVLSLVEGALTVQFEEQGQVETAVFERVSGSGPTGVNAPNLAGIYRASFEDAYLALFDNGTYNWIGARGEGATLQSGTYEATASTVTVTFRFSTDPETPSGTVVTFDYVLQGDLLTFVDPEGNETFQRCPESPRPGVEGTWTQEFENGDGFNLILYRGEFAGASWRPQ